MNARRAFSLLEVLLAMTILMGSIAVLGELVRLGTRNAQSAQQLTQAVLVCENLLAELAASDLPIEPVTEAPVLGVPGWRYALERNPTSQPGLFAVRVTVTQDIDPARKPLSASLVTLVRRQPAQLDGGVSGAEGGAGWTDPANSGAGAGPERMPNSLPPDLP